jgi:Abortive infection alpha
MGSQNETSRPSGRKRAVMPDAEGVIAHAPIAQRQVAQRQVAQRQLAQRPLDQPPVVQPTTGADALKIEETVTSLMSELPVLAASLESVRSQLRQTVSTALHRRRVPDAELVWPRPDIAVPAIEALRYSSLSQEFANLIASSMDRRTAYSVLPAYVEVLKQLNPDEVDLLKRAPAQGRFVPIADIVYVLPSEQVIAAYRNLITTNLAGVCTYPRNIPQYVDNLIRLNLLARPLGQQADEASYRTLIRQPFVKAVMKAAPPRSQAGLDKGVIGITDFGEHFRRACLA